MLELYHYGFSTCSQKVRLVFAEKGLDFTSHEIDIIGGQQHDPDYVRLNPNHVVPTLVHDGVPFLESTLINEYLDEAFPAAPMRPADARGRHAVRAWTKYLDEKVHGATAAVTFALGPRQLLLHQPAEVREANVASIPDPVHRAARRSVIEHGVEAPEFATALRTMIAFLDRIERLLAPGKWLSGPSYGLADAAALPYVLRLDHLAMTPLLDPAARPALADWYDRARAPQLRDRRRPVGARTRDRLHAHGRRRVVAVDRGDRRPGRRLTEEPPCHAFNPCRENRSPISNRWPASPRR